MTIIKWNTKRGQDMVKRAQNWEGKYLSQVYDSYSKAKESAWWDCFTMCQAEGGEQFSIISHNSFGFSVSWFTNEGVRIETPRNSYLIPWEEEAV